MGDRRHRGGGGGGGGGGPWRGVGSPVVRGRLAELVATSLIFGAVAGSGTAVAAAAHVKIMVRPTAALAVLTRTHRVYSSYRTGRSRVGTVNATRPITGEGTVLPVVGRAGAPGGLAGCW